MTKTTISVQQGLNEVKLYDSKISRALRTAKFASIEEKGSVRNANKTVADFKKDAQGSYDSVMALIKNRDTIKQAIILSNATTEVTIAGETMTVAEAIERKTSIANESALQRKMEQDLSYAQDEVQMINRNIDLDAQRVIDKALDGKSKDNDTKELVENIQKQYDSRKAKVLEGVKDLQKKTVDLGEKIAQFRSDVDFVLTTSNCTTTIEVNLVD